MRSTGIIFRKELRDTLRDHRTLITMFLIPLLIIPIAINFMGRMGVAGADDDGFVRVVVVASDNGHDLEWKFRGDQRFFVQRATDAESAKAMVQSNDADVALVVPADFDVHLRSGRSGSIDVFFSHLQSPQVRRSVHDRLRAFENDVLGERFESFDAPATLASAVQYSETELTRPDEILGRMMGGLLPYILIIFCFLGCMYPALDLGAGEKERGTMETLLTAPASRIEIVLGKFGVVVLAGLASAMVALIGMYLGMLPHAGGDSVLIQTMKRFLAPQNTLITMVMIVPLTMFFAAILLTVSVFARSFKEAQSIITPLTIVAIFPAGIALMPSIELTPVTAFVPVLNVSLAAKSLATGGLPIAEAAITFGVLSLFAATALYGCSLYFHRESIIFRA
jgi:sodium transport system permease protein